MSHREPQKPPRRCDSQNCGMNANREMNEFYREAGPGILSDSYSSDDNSYCEESDYHTSCSLPRHRSLTQRDEISEKLSQLKLSSNQKKGSTNDSILARSPIGDDIDQTLASVADSRFSCILAGRLDEEDNVRDERSLLNIAINESKEKFEDSLDDVSRSITQRDSPKAEAFARGENAENSDPNVQGNGVRRTGGLPKIVSNEAVNIPIRMVGRRVEIEVPVAKETEEPADNDNSVLRDKNDNITEVSEASSTRMENAYESLMCEKERFVIANIKTPNPKGIHFIEDCCKSSPKVGVNADTFGSEFITDISDLSTLGEIDGDPHLYRKKIMRKFSQQFAKEPTLFTEKLLALFEESFMPNSKAESMNASGVNLSRLTEEFRKICAKESKRIEDESMPNFTQGQSFVCTTPPANGDQTASSFQNFSKLGGGKKVYRKTPRRVFKRIGNVCGTPNCGNALHRGMKGGLDSPGNSTGYDSTMVFEFWENLCFEMSPTKQSNAKSLSNEIPEEVLLTHEELIRKSDEQMASLDESEADNPEGEEDERNCSMTSSRECQDNSNSMRKRFIENLSSSLRNGTDKSVEENVANFNCKQKYYEVENSLAAQLAEKRRKCFEEARKVFEKKENALPASSGKPSKKVSELTDKIDALSDDRFFSTLAACVDYIDHARTLRNHRNSLHCILECSEGSESVRERLSDSRSLEFVETVILPVNRMGGQKKSEAVTKTPKLVSHAQLYVPGTPGHSSAAKSAPTSSRECSRRSAGRRLSPNGHPSSVAKKIRSPVSPVQRKNTRVAKPACHASVPRTPCGTPRGLASGGSQKSWGKSSSRFQLSSNNKLKSAKNSPGLTDVTNIKKSGDMPKVVVTKPSPDINPQKQRSGLKVGENMEVDCQRQLHFSETNTPEETARKNKFFFTPDKTPTYGRVRPKKKYFQTPRETPSRNKILAVSPSVPGAHRINYNIVQSPVGNYIRGTDPNLITNVRGKTNERMLTPRSKTPGSARSKVISPILARSPRLAQTSSETSRLKFQLNPQREQNQESDILNIALCESDRVSNVGSESTSHLPFPKIFYKAPSVKMVKNDSPQRRVPKTVARGTEEKIIYRHEGRFKSATQPKVPSLPVDCSTKDSLSSYDSGDISVLHQRPAVKTNYLFKK